MKNPDTIIIGAGAAGLICAIEAAKSGKKILLLDKAEKPAQKIRISGGGKCNFTNINVSADNYISENPHFCKSALKRYGARDFIEMVEKYNINYHEKTLGQLFCNNKAQDIIDMLLTECRKYDITIITKSNVEKISKEKDNQFKISTNNKIYKTKIVVIATGGLSIPKMGSTDFAYKVAKQFGLRVVEPTAALVPLVFDGDELEKMKKLSGISVNASVCCGKICFREGLLFTHRGLSGPSILQISSYWKKGKEIIINLCPDHNIIDILIDNKLKNPKKKVSSIINEYLPKRLTEQIIENMNLNKKIAEISNKRLEDLANRINKWSIIPRGTEGFKTAEVTKGGIDTAELSSKTFECKKVTGLYFIGEAIDVTGHLGGYNFQWAWSSGYSCGQSINALLQA